MLGFVNLQESTKTFLEVFFNQIIMQSQGNDAMSRNAGPLLSFVYKLEENVMLAKGIDWYLKKKNVEKADLASGHNMDLIVWGVGILRKGIAEILLKQ